MKKVARRRGSVAIDTVPLPEKPFGMRTKKGKVSNIRGKYYLTIGKRRLELPVGILIQKSKIQQHVGKEVVAFLSKKSGSEVVAIGTWPTPEKPIRIRKQIICYIPAPDMMRRMERNVRTSLIMNMLDKGIITSKLAEELIRGL